MAKPKNPTNVKAVYDATNNQVALTWTLPVSSPATTSVKIQRWVDNTQLYTDLATVGVVSSYMNTSPTAGRTYAYRLLAINSEGSQAVYSTPSNKVLIIAKPEAATAVTAQRNSNDSVGINWQNTTSVLKPVEYNYVWRWDSVTKTTVQINKISGALKYYLDSTAPLDRGLMYRLWSANVVGGAFYMSPYSGTAYTTPAAPTNVSARWVGNDIILSWKNPSTIASKFDIEHTTDGVNWFPVATLGKATSWRHITPERGVLHRYRVRPTSPNPTLGTAAVGIWVSSANVPAQSTPNPPTILGPPFAPAGTSFTIEIRHNPVDNSPMGAAQVRHRAAGSGTWSAAIAGLDVPAYASGNIEVQAATRTTDSAFGDWSTTTLVKVKARPAPTLSSPSAGAVITGPLIPLAWTAGTQTAFEAELLEGSVVVQTQSGTTERKTSFDAENSKSYTVRFRISDGDIWSNWITRSITTSFTSPGAPVVTLIVDPDNLNVTANVSAVTGTTSREVLRRIAGSTGNWISVGFTDSNGFILDPRPPLGVELEYVGVVWGSNQTSGVSPSQFITVDRHVVVVNYGPGLGASAYMEVDLSALNVKIQRERALHQFAGRSLPVVVMGAALNHSVSASGRVVDEIGSPSKIWNQMVTTPGDKWFRDPEGRSFLCSVESVQIGEQDGWMDVSFTADEVQAL